MKKIFATGVGLWLLFVSSPSAAYIGLGPLLPVVGSFLIYLFVVLLAVIGILGYPIKRLLNRLKKLELHNNQLDGQLPQVISGWESLEELNLSNNKLSGYIPDNLGEQDSLKFLNLSFNYLEGDIPSSLLENENLELLYLHVNNLKGVISESICKRENPMKFLFYNNLLCPPYPDCIKYIGSQECKN